MKSQKKQGTFGRLFGIIRRYYPKMLPLTVFCIIFSAVVSSIPSLFMERVITIITNTWESGDWASVSGEVFQTVAILAGLYLLSLGSGILFNQLMAIMTQGILKKMREQLFHHM